MLIHSNRTYNYKIVNSNYLVHQQLVNALLDNNNPQNVIFMTHNSRPFSIHGHGTWLPFTFDCPSLTSGPFCGTGNKTTIVHDHGVITSLYRPFLTG